MTPLFAADPITIDPAKWAPWFIPIAIALTVGLISILWRILIWFFRREMERIDNGIKMITGFKRVLEDDVLVRLAELERHNFGQVRRRASLRSARDGRESDDEWAEKREVTRSFHELPTPGPEKPVPPKRR